jgi:hypothetical protein
MQWWSMANFISTVSHECMHWHKKSRQDNSQNHRSAHDVTAVQEADEYVLKSFPEGSKITIIEPFYKIAAAGNRTIRVEDPADVIITPPSPQPSTGVDQAGALAATIEHSKKLLKEGVQICG